MSDAYVINSWIDGSLDLSDGPPSATEHRFLGLLEKSDVAVEMEEKSVSFIGINDNTSYVQLKVLKLFL